MGIGNQKSGVRGPGKKAFALCCLFFAFCLMFSSVKAFAWSPEDVLKEHLKENYPWAEIGIDDLSISDQLPDEQPSNVIVEKGPLGKSVFTMEFKNDVKVTATGNVKAFDWVVMSGRALRKGHYLQKDDIFTKLMDVTRIPKGAIRNTEEVMGKPLARSIVANVPFKDTMVSNTSAVKRGQKVTLVIESSSFIITALGEIRENSSVGKQVKAVNLASKKVISGVLMDENTVKVEF